MGYTSEDITSWEECRIGFIPRRCYYTNKILWPFSKATSRSLFHISDKGMWVKRFYARYDEAVYANLRMK